MKINNDIIIKLILVYWLLLLVAQVFFSPFSSWTFGNQNGGIIKINLIEWGLIFNFAVVIPAAVVVIIKILQWKK
jgi:hypothetical protein